MSAADTIKTTAVIIPFPSGVPAPEFIAARCRDAKSLRSLAESAERRAYLTGYLDAMLRVDTDKRPR